MRLGLSHWYGVPRKQCTNSCFEIIASQIPDNALVKTTLNFVDFLHAKTLWFVAFKYSVPVSRTTNLIRRPSIKIKKTFRT